MGDIDLCFVVLLFYRLLDVHVFIASQHNTARRDINIAFLFVCLTVRPSITRSYCVKTTETDRSAVSASDHGCKTFFNVFCDTDNLYFTNVGLW